MLFTVYAKLQTLSCKTSDPVMKVKIKLKCGRPEGHINTFITTV